MLICFFNSKLIFNVPISVIVLLLHTFYMLYINLKIKPYQNSLKIHQRTIVLQHFIYWIFLVLINFINFI
jgi:hypothetical protein